MTAVISPCEKYRYNLTRRVSDQHDRILFIMLNPSTADASVDDPTIRKCKGFAQRLEAGSIEVVNLFAYRATKPHDLWSFAVTDDVIGPDNDKHIAEALQRAQMVICAWGSQVDGKATALARINKVKELAEEAGRQLYCLSLSKKGIPRHPLMLGYKHQPLVWG